LAKAFKTRWIATAYDPAMTVPCHCERSEAIQPPLSTNDALILKTAVDGERFENSRRYAVRVGANLFALNALFVGMNSHLQNYPPRNLG